MRTTPEEMLEEVKRRLTVKHWNYSFTPHEWFFPGDAAPHNTTFKRHCKKLHELGLLEGRQGGRWGRSYRVPESTNKGLNDKEVQEE